MKPGPGVSELRDARWRRCSGCTLVRRGLGSRAFGRDQRASGTPGTRPWGQADARAGQGVCELSPRPLPAASHPLPNIRRPSVLGSGKVSWATNRLGSIAFFPLGTDRPRTPPREDIGFCFKTEPSC